MNTNKKLAALLLISAATLSTHANAAQSGLEMMVSKLIGNAVNNVSIEIDQQVQKITLTASNMLSINSTSDTVGTVTITDITTKNVAQTPESIDTTSSKKPTMKSNKSDLAPQEERNSDN